MKPLSRFIKGTIISLMLVMVLSLCSVFVAPQSSFSGIPAAYAQDGGEGEGEGEDEGEDDGLDQDLQDLLEFDEVVATIAPLPKAPKDAKDKDELIKKVARTANWSHRLFAPMINFFAFNIGNFLGTDYIFGGPMGEMLHKIWVISRNLVNIAFVFLLLFLALKEIFDVTGESNLSKNLIKFVLLLVAVNFSWLGTKVVLDAANVVTHIVFAIPSGIAPPSATTTPDGKTDSSSEGNCEVNSYPEKKTKGMCYPSLIIAPADSGLTTPLYWQDKEETDDDNCQKVQDAYSEIYDEKGDKVKLADDHKFKNLQGRTSICMENLNFVKYDQNTAVIYLTYGMARIQNLIRTEGTPKIDELAVSVLLSLVIQMAFSISLLVLFIALVIRMAILWFFVAFSPFIVLVIWFSESAYSDKEVGGFKFGIPEFVSWAFVPAKVGAIFAISFIMISAGQAISAVDLTAFDNVRRESGVIVKIPSIESLFGGIGSLQQFIWLLMSLVVLWLGTFGILGQMTIVKDITGKIKGWGETTAEKIATLPYKAPLLPLGKGGKPQSVQETLGMLDVRKHIDEYVGDGGKTEDTRTLNRNAGSDKARAAVSSVKSSDKFSPAQAKQIAKSHGLTLSEFVSLDKNVQKEALMKSGAGDHAGKIIDELKRIEKLEGRARKRTDRIIKKDGKKPAAAPKPAAVPPAAVPPGGTPPGGTKPAAPKPPAPTGPPGGVAPTQ